MLGEELAADLHVMWLRGIHPDREWQPEILDEDAALCADRPAATTTGVVEGGTSPAAAHRLGVDHHHRRLGVPALRALRGPGAAMRTIARAQTPFSRHRRHCCQTASHGGYRVGQVAPLAAGAGHEQDGGRPSRGADSAAGAPRRPPGRRGPRPPPTRDRSAR